MNRQNWNAEKYQTEASFVPQLANPVLQLLEPKAGEKILDLGCGDGKLTQQIAGYQCDVLGIDNSHEMIKVAKEKGLNVKILPAESIRDRTKFDAVFSNAVLHWVSDLNLVVNNVYTALKPGGRFIGEFGGRGNINSLIEMMSLTFAENPDWGIFNNPWYFPSVAEYCQILDRVGFTIIYLELIPRPTPLKSGVSSWLEIFAEGIINHLNEEQKQKFITDLTAKLKPILYSDVNGWIADYVRIRFKAVKP